MINKKVISRNILFAFLQILFTGITYFFLYILLLKTLGSKLMGVWSIVLSISSSANIANMGIGSSVLRYTAKYNIDNEYDQINKLLQTSFLFMLSIFSVICFVIYMIAPYWLKSVVGIEYYEIATSLIPYSLICLLLNALSNIFFACFDGLQKNYIRSVLQIISLLILLGSSYLLLDKWGITGVAYAQLLQSLFLFLAAPILLKINLKSFRFFPLVWHKTTFKKIFTFGLQEQIISLCQLCFDPLTKSILGSFNLSMVSYYEMANRLVIQLRAFLVSANQVFIPVFTSTNEGPIDSKQRIYKSIFNTNYLFSVFWLAIIIAAAIPISKIWIGEVNTYFIQITVILSCAYWFNILANPSYFSNIGSATLKDNVVSQMSIAILNVLLGIGLGYILKGTGVILGWSIALAIGSSYNVYKYNQRNNIPFSTLLSGKDLFITVCLFVYFISCFCLFYYFPNMNVWLMFGIIVFFITLLIGVMLIVHPLGKTVLGILKSKFRPTTK